MANTQPAALCEVIYIDASPQRAAALPKQHARIAFVQQRGLEERYVIPQAGRWSEVTQETALQRAEGLRRLRTEPPCGQRSEQEPS